MLGYISSTRKKSCKQCVKAKRRCDLGYPCCKRCFSKALDCAYPNASVREAEVVIRQQTPDLAPLAGDADIVWPEAPLQAQSDSLDPALLQLDDSNASSSPDSEHGNSVYWKRGAEPQVSRHFMPKVWAPSFLNEDQILYLVSRLRSFIGTLAFTGHTTFIHASLYRTYQPTAFQDSIALSALYLAKTKQNAPILANSINEKINGLIANADSWTLHEHLAAVQALVVYQIIRLFDGDLGVQASAARQNRLLELWAARLWKRSFAEPIAFSKPWDAWVFYESLRRTVLISVYMRGGWNALTQDGLCDQVPVLARLPLSKGDGMWDIDAEEFERRIKEGDSAEQLVAYGDFSVAWEPGMDLRVLSEWQRLLLAPCRGAVDPRLYMEA